MDVQGTSLGRKFEGGASLRGTSLADTRSKDIPMDYKVIWGPLQKNVVTVHFWGVFEGVPYSLDLGPSSYFSRVLEA